MTVSVYESRDDDRVRRIDYLRLSRCLELGPNPLNLLALDQHISLEEVPHLGIHAHNGAALQEDVLAGSDALPPDTVQRAGVLDGRTLPCLARALEKWDSRSSKGRPRLEQATPGNTATLPTTHDLVLHRVAAFLKALPRRARKRMEPTAKNIEENRDLRQERVRPREVMRYCMGRRRGNLRYVLAVELRHLLTWILGISDVGRRIRSLLAGRRDKAG